MMLGAHDGAPADSPQYRGAWRAVCPRPTGTTRYSRSIASTAAGDSAFPLATRLSSVTLGIVVARETGLATHLFCAADLDSTPLPCEWIWSGAIGGVREVQPPDGRRRRRGQPRNRRRPRGARGTHARAARRATALRPSGERHRPAGDGAIARPRRRRLRATACRARARGPEAPQRWHSDAALALNGAGNDTARRGAGR